MVSNQALFRLSVYKITAVYLSGAKNVCFCTIRDFSSPTISHNQKQIFVSSEVQNKILSIHFFACIYTFYIHYIVLNQLVLKRNESYNSHVHG